MSSEAELEQKRLFMEEREKDLNEKQRQFEIRMKEQQERFLKDKKGYEAGYQKRL